MTPSEAAAGALDYIARDGWCKCAVEMTPMRRMMLLNYPERISSHVLEWKIGSHCAGGAMNLALSGGKSTWWSHPDSAYSAVASVIRERFPSIAARVNPCSSSPDRALVMIFNDDEHVSYDDVIWVLRKAGGLS